jgi:hypothetical protein
MDERLRPVFASFIPASVDELLELQVRDLVLVDPVALQLNRSGAEHTVWTTLYVNHAGWCFY